MQYSPDKRARGKTGKAFLAGGTPLQIERAIMCPYCGESFVSIIDASAGSQSYYEDCEICCRPILVNAEVDGDGDLIGITTQRDDD